MLAGVTAVHAPPSMHGRPARPVRPALAGVLLAASAVVAMALPARVAATPADTTTTHAYLLAEYALAQAFLRDAPVSLAHTTALLESLGNECHGVLAGEPSEEGPQFQEGAPTPRARGERQRSERQRDTINQELSRALEVAGDQPDLAAVEAYGAQTTALSWSDPRVAPLVGRYAGYLKERATLPAPNVCADMKAWAASGYHVLSPASRTFEAAEAARLESLAPPAPSLSSLRSLLKRYEGPAERALARRTDALLVRYAEEDARSLKQDLRLQRALGVPENPLEAREHEPVLGRGNTPAGARFIVRDEPPTSSFGSSCRRSVSVEFIEPAKEGSGSFSRESSETSLCLSEHGEGPSVACGEKTEEISLAVPPAVRTVRPELSNGHAITSRVIRIPSRYGGPGGVYAQALRIPTPYPISLIELDRSGRIVHALKREDLPRCRRESAPQGPKFVALARGITPSGEPFAIEGSFVRFAHNHTDFSVEVTAGNFRSRGEEATGTLGGSEPKAFDWSLADECPPHPYAIIYGLLSAPGDSVLARTPEGLVALNKVQIAAHFHSKGPLVYGVFSTVPTELIVRRSDGSTLYTQSLTGTAREGTEFCEGYAEG